MGFLTFENTAEVEEKKTVYLLPKRIVKTNGCVKDAQRVIEKKKYYQINLNDSDTCSLKNGRFGKKAGILFDIGFEISGGVRILCSGTSCGYGEILIRFGESASEALTPVGTKNSTNDHAIREFTVPITGLSDQTWGETGYRFVYIELQTVNAEITVKSVLGAFSYRDLDYKGSFRCNDELINRIFDVSAYTCHLCLQNYLWDGIKRDRLVWLGDSHPEMLTVQSVFGRLRVFENSIDEARDCYPLPEWINGMPSYSLWWMIIIHDWFVYTGDRAYLEANAEYLKGITSQAADCVTSDGKLNFPSYFIDWPNHDTPAEKEGVKALAVIALNKASKLLDILGNSDLSEKASSAAKKLLDAGADCLGSKSTQAMAWLAGFDSDEKTAALLLEGGAKGVSTFFSYYILSALFGSGKKKEALDILKEYYGGMLEMGATTFWEDFNTQWMKNSCPVDRLPENGENDIHGDFGAFCYKSFRHSLCHGWSSGPAPFLLHNVLGVKIDSTSGKTKAFISPALSGLAFAEGSCALPDGGVIRVKVTDENGRYNISYDAPEGVEVTVTEN